MSAGDGASGDPGTGGVLGNLPRSRPGHRSDKRAGPEPNVDAPSDRSSVAARRRSAAGADRGSARPVEAAPDAAPNGGPLGGAARVAGRAARAGLGVAGGVLKRLPRP